MYLTLMMASTADGKIAKNTNHNADWTTKADKKQFIAMTKKIGTIIMGETTFKVMGSRPLPGRLNVILTKNLTDKTDIPGNLKYLTGAPADIIRQLENEGVTEAILGGGAYTNGSFLVEKLIDELMITYEPKIFGNGLPIFSGFDFDVNLELLEVKVIGDNAFVARYQVIY